jgi:hypothetical protein
MMKSEEKKKRKDHLGRFWHPWPSSLLPRPTSTSIPHGPLPFFSPPPAHFLLLAPTHQGHRPASLSGDAHDTDWWGPLSARPSTSEPRSDSVRRNKPRRIPWWFDPASSIQAFRTHPSLGLYNLERPLVVFITGKAPWTYGSRGERTSVGSCPPPQIHLETRSFFCALSTLVRISLRNSPLSQLRFELVTVRFRAPVVR